MNKSSSHTFNSIAFAYDRLASWVFGDSLKQAQAATLNFIQDESSVLIIGGGSGWYLQQLLLHTKPGKVVYIEASTRMMSLTRKKVAPLLPRFAGELELRTGTEENINPDEKFDAIITHFFLDIFAPARLNKIISALYHVLTPDGIWLVADFRLKKSSHFWLYYWHKLLINSMYLFFIAISRISARQLPDFGQLFYQLHMQGVYERTFYRGLVFSCVYRRTINSIPINESYD